MGQVVRGFGWLIGRLGFRSDEGKPEIWLKIRHRQPDGWRVVDLMVNNRLPTALKVTEITLGWSNWGTRIAPAIVLDDDLGTIEIDKTRVGRTIKLARWIRPQGTLRWQTVSFYLWHPRDAVNDGRYTIRIKTTIERATERGRSWTIAREGQLPQSPGDPVVFSENGPVP
ncbi:hypothetical protein L6654_08070 [Bradyrhizobium sp. WYCCWR 13023]|uniref:Uncharacterized protein n=1 Tax=Bradyrhizobium zhengyangense TaxID=2911009 RepID=A0A9X1U931_9BRAD|nr:hypothetical protein [Bradyrhizobium zhengyangense]MCG2626578.1 hypothetical protein [Bradyrhizobium zhengyangense]